MKATLELLAFLFLCLALVAFVSGGTGIGLAFAGLSVAAQLAVDGLRLR